MGSASAELELQVNKKQDSTLIMSPTSQGSFYCGQVDPDPDPDMVENDEEAGMDVSENEADPLATVSVESIKRMTEICGMTGVTDHQIEASIEAKSIKIFKMYQALKKQERDVFWKKNMGSVSLTFGKVPITVICRRHYKPDARKSLVSQKRVVEKRSKPARKKKKKLSCSRKVLQKEETPQPVVNNIHEGNSAPHGISEDLPDEILIDGRRERASTEEKRQEPRKNRRPVAVPKRYQDNADVRPAKRSQITLLPNRYRIGVLPPKYSKRIEYSAGYSAWVKYRQRPGQFSSKPSTRSSHGDNFCLFFISEMNESGETVDLIEELKRVQESIEAEENEVNQVTSSESQSSPEPPFATLRPEKLTCKLITLVCEECQSTTYLTEAPPSTSAYLCPGCARMKKNRTLSTAPYLGLLSRQKSRRAMTTTEPAVMPRYSGVKIKAPKITPKWLVDAIHSVPIPILSGETFKRKYPVTPGARRPIPSNYSPTLAKFKTFATIRKIMLQRRDRTRMPPPHPQSRRM